MPDIPWIDPLLRRLTGICLPSRLCVRCFSLLLMMIETATPSDDVIVSLMSVQL